eukprot:gene39492-48799_t
MSPAVSKSIARPIGGSASKLPTSYPSGSLTPPRKSSGLEMAGGTHTHRHGTANENTTDGSYKYGQNKGGIAASGGIAAQGAAPTGNNKINKNE